MEIDEEEDEVSEEEEDEEWEVPQWDFNPISLQQQQKKKSMVMSLWQMNLQLELKEWTDDTHFPQCTALSIEQYIQKLWVPTCPRPILGKTDLTHH